MSVGQIVSTHNVGRALSRLHMAIIWMFVASWPIATAAAPNVAPLWSARFSGVNFDAAIVDVHFDMPSQRFRFLSNITQDGKPMQELDFLFRNRAPYALNLTVAARQVPSLSGSMCFPNAMSWEDSVVFFGFGWLKNASWMKNRTVNNEPCEVWSLSWPKRGNWSACIGLDGVPRAFDTIMDSKQIGSSLSEYYNMIGMTAEKIAIGPPPNMTFAATSSCASWPPAHCPNQGVKTMKIYRLTGFPLSTPADQNCNDLHATLSKATWCTGAPWASSSTLVGYDMSMSTEFAQFAMCDYVVNSNGYNCKGNPVGERNVGRTYTGKTCIRPGQCGQCSTIPVVENAIGEWYSFPKAGMCNHNETIGMRGCTWKVTGLQVKNVSCILERTGIKQKCNNISNPDVWKKINETFFSAMASEADGGCPSLPPHQTTGGSMRAEWRTAQPAVSSIVV